MSTPVEASVTIASVRSGMISETAPTNVVLPAPNPPAITIFVAAAPCPLECASECLKATQCPSYELVALIAGRTVGQRPMHPKVTGRDPSAHPDPPYTHGQIQPSRDFRDRGHLDAQLDDPASHVARRPAQRQPVLRRLHRRFQRKVDISAGSPGRQRVRADQLRLTGGQTGLQ